MSFIAYFGGTDRLPPTLKPPMPSKASTTQLRIHSVILRTQQQERKHYLDSLEQLRSNAQKYAEEYAHLTSRLASSLLEAYPDILENPDLSHVLQGPPCDDLLSWHTRSILWKKQATNIERLLVSVEKKRYSDPVLKGLVQVIVQIDRLLKDPEKIGLACQLLLGIEI